MPVNARIVERVGVAVIPDTSKFMPSLRKYLERIERQARAQIAVTLDLDRIETAARTAHERVRRALPQVDVPVLPDSDQFLERATADVKSLTKRIEARIPLTADGESLRRDVSVKVRQIEADIKRLSVEVPLSMEDASRARAELRAKIAGLQALAKTQGVEVPLSVGSAVPAGGALLNPGMIAGLAAAAAVLGGGVIAALPALIASIAAPVGVIALGFEGIKKAAQEAAPEFQKMRDAVSGTFLTGLAPAFAALGDMLPKITPQLQGIATALSGAFSTIVAQITSPAGIAAIQGILDGIREAIEILTPVLAPMTQTFLEVAQTGMGAFVAMAPALLDALTMLTDLFTYLNESGMLGAAARGFALMVVAGVALVAGLGAVMIAATTLWVAMWTMYVKIAEAAAGVKTTVTGMVLTAAAALATFASTVSAKAQAAGDALKTKIKAGIDAAVTVIQGLPGRAASAASGLASAVAAKAQAMADQLKAKIKAGIDAAVAFVRTLPSRAAAALSGMSLAGAGARLIQSLADGMLSRLRSVLSAAAAIASAVKGFFPGSPVKTGPLTSWNNGGAGRRLGDMLASGMLDSRSAIASASAGMAGAVVSPSAAGYSGTSGVARMDGGVRLHPDDVNLLAAAIRRGASDGISGLAGRAMTHAPVGRY